jgi:hypothetical protein
MPMLARVFQAADAPVGGAKQGSHSPQTSPDSLRAHPTFAVVTGSPPDSPRPIVRAWGSRGRRFKSGRPDCFSNALGTNWEPNGNDHGWPPLGMRCGVRACAGALLPLTASVTPPRGDAGGPGAVKKRPVQAAWMVGCVGTALPNLPVLENQGGTAARRRGPTIAPGLRPWGGPGRRASALMPSARR